VVLTTHLIEKLRYDKVIISALSMLEMFLASIMDDADVETTQALIGNMTPTQLEWFDLLLQLRDGTHHSFLGWLQQPTGRASANSFLNIVDCLTFLQGIDLDLSTLQHINANRLNQLSRAVKSRSAWRIKQITNPDQRHAMLVAFALQLHATDTKGFSDHIFALCHLLGFRFAPHIRRFGHLRLYPIKSKSTYPTLKPIMGRRINTDLIYENWHPLLRIASSLKLGTVTTPIFVQRLAAYPRQNQWAKALSQVGRLERTLFALRWIQDEALRKQVNTALYKGEARNALARAVCLHRLGWIRDRDYDSQRYRASALNLVVSALIIWNTVYIEQAVNHLRSQGMEITDHHLEHLTPLGWEHISLTGDYVWNPNLTTNLTNLRDLRV